MSYTPNLNDKSSPYYYGTDSTYKVGTPKTAPKKSKGKPIIELDFYGVPTVKGFAPPKAEKPAAPAKPAVEPPSVQQAPTTKPTQPVGSSDKSERTNENGLKQYGMKLGGLNQFTKDFTGYEIADIKSAFQSEDLPTAYQTGTNKISTEQTAYELPEGSAPSPLNKGLAGSQGLKIQEGSYTIADAAVPASVPGTLGRSGDAQEGASDKPDIAEEVRTIRMRRKGPRDEGSFRGFTIDRQNAEAQRPKSAAPDEAKIAQQKRRNDIRSTFLDMDTPIVKAAVAANAKAGHGTDSDGNTRFNYGGELLYAKEGMEQQAKNAANMGMNPSQFLDMPETPDAQPDTPANAEISMTAPIKDMNEAQQKQAAQEFAKGFVSDIAGKLKKK